MTGSPRSGFGKQTTSDEVLEGIHLGHLLLTCLLAPALRAGAPARVVSVSSAAHVMSPVVFEDVQFEARPYDKWVAYGSRRAQTCSSPSSSRGAAASTWRIVASARPSAHERARWATPPTPTIRRRPSACA